MAVQYVPTNRVAIGNPTRKRKSKRTAGKAGTRRSAAKTGTSKRRPAGKARTLRGKRVRVTVQARANPLPRRRQAVIRRRVHRNPGTNGDKLSTVKGVIEVLVPVTVGAGAALAIKHFIASREFYKKMLIENPANPLVAALPSAAVAGACLALHHFVKHPMVQKFAKFGFFAAVVIAVDDAMGAQIKDFATGVGKPKIPPPEVTGIFDHQDFGGMYLQTDGSGQFAGAYVDAGMGTPYPVFGTP